MKKFVESVKKSLTTNPMEKIAVGASGLGAGLVLGGQFMAGILCVCIGLVLLAQTDQL